MRFVPEYNLWWPDFEEDALRELAHIMKRVPDCDQVMHFVDTHGIAVQAGGHCGLYARQLAKYFTFVHTFEPIPAMHECLNLNASGGLNIITHRAALGQANDGTITMGQRAGGRSKVDPAGPLTVPMRSIDGLNLPRCDLIYLDIEGYEIDALLGASRTIKTFHPTVVVEVLEGRRDATEEWAKHVGYKHVRQFHADWVFIPA